VLRAGRDGADRTAGAAVHGATTQVQGVLAEAASDEYVVVDEAGGFQLHQAAGLADRPDAAATRW
jgi:hypothetical protein